MLKARPGVLDAELANVGLARNLIARCFDYAWPARGASRIGTSGPWGGGWIGTEIALGEPQRAGDGSSDHDILPLDDFQSHSYENPAELLD
jgi:hypothetical protein